jgi:hypothetical protein
MALTIIKTPDNTKSLIGSGNDLELYHDGTHSFIDNITGDLKIRNAGANDDSNIYIQAVNGENSIVCRDDAQVELYFNDAKKLETTSGGATLTGDFTINDGTPGIYLVDTNDNDTTGYVAHTSGNLKIEADTTGNTAGSSIRFSVDGTEEVRILAGGGITFNGDTAADNSINDYEQGSWTATSAQGTCNNPETCRYQKIGQTVWLWGAVDDFSDRTGTVDVKITGLPFTVSENGYGTAIFYRVAYTDDVGQIGALVNTSEEIKFLVSSQGGSESWFYIDYNDLNSDTSQIKFAIWYRTTQ